MIFNKKQLINYKLPNNLLAHLCIKYANKYKIYKNYRMVIHVLRIEISFLNVNFISFSICIIDQFYNLQLLVKLIPYAQNAMSLEVQPP